MDPQWREFCQRYSNLDNAGKQALWEGLDGYQQEHFQKVWEEFIREAVPTKTTGQGCLKTTLLVYAILFVGLVGLTMLLILDKRESEPKQKSQAADIEVSQNTGKKLNEDLRKSSNRKHVKQQTEPIAIPKYKIMDKTIHPGSKASVDVMLEARATREQLMELAFRIKNECGNQPRTFILYYLSDAGPEYGVSAWASTHFNPHLTVDIIGSTQKQADKMFADDGKTDVVGRWLQEGVGSFVLTIYWDRGHLKGEFKIMGGSKIIDKMNNVGNKYWTDRNPGEYFLIEPNGNLGLYGVGEGKAWELKRID